MPDVRSDTRRPVTVCGDLRCLRARTLDAKHCELDLSFRLEDMKAFAADVETLLTEIVELAIRHRPA